MSRRLELGVRQNLPQLRATSAIFDEQGRVQRHRTAFAGFGRGVGKSHWRRQIWYALISLYEYKPRLDALEPFRGVRITSLAPTLKQWKEINWGGIEEELGPSGKWAFLRGKLDRQSGHIKFPGGSIVRPFPASEYNARTARGMRTDVLDADEIDDIDAGVYDGVAVPWLSEPWSLSIQLLSGTPTRGRHGLWWRSAQAGKLGEAIRSGTISRDEALSSDAAKAILQVFEELPADEWPVEVPRDPEDATLFVLSGFFAFHATYKDAPETVSALAVARARATTPDATFKREWLADPDAGEGLVYVFDEKFHVREPPPRATFREFVVGMDHGTVDAGVLLLCGIQGHGEDATLWVLEEHYESGIPNHIWDARAKAWSFAKFWPDTSRADRIQDLRAMGLDVGETDRGPGSILAGIARVADLLFVRKVETTGPAFRQITEERARLYVAPSCKHTIAEFGKYRRKKLPDGTFDEDPEDKWNHAMDSLRYACLGRFGRLPNYRHTTAR